MASKTNSCYNLKLLKPLREKLELTLEEASQKIAVAKTGLSEEQVKKKKIEKLKSWENGVSEPTNKQLNDLFVYTYFHPISSLFFPELQTKNWGIRYFKIYPQKLASALTGIEKRQLIGFEVKIANKQDLVSHIADEEEWGDVEILGSLKDSLHSQEIALKIYKLLQVTPEEILHLYKKSGGNKVFQLLRDRMEGLGIFVFCLNRIIFANRKYDPLPPGKFFQSMSSFNRKTPLVVINSELKVKEKILALIREFAGLITDIKDNDSFLYEIALLFTRKFCEDLPPAILNKGKAREKKGSEKSREDVIQEIIERLGKKFISAVKNGHAEGIVSWSDALQAVNFDIGGISPSRL